MFLPVVVGLIVLGRAFDLHTFSTTENQIFDTKTIEENIQIIPQTCTQKHYRVVTSAHDVNRVLGLHPGVSLKAKRGLVQLEGLTEYLTTVVDKNNTVEILMVVDFETQSVSFPSRLPTIEDWRSKPQSEVGTHYVSSITYGGRLLVSLRLRPTHTKHIKDVERAVREKIPQSGAIDELFFRNLEHIVNNAHTKASVEYKVWSTAGIFHQPTTFDEVVYLVRNYEDYVRRIHQGKGNTLKFELTDLNRVQSNYSKFEENQALEWVMEEANEKLEDLRMAVKILKDWRNTEPTMSDEEEELVKAFTDQLKSAMQALAETIRSLHFDGKSNQFSEAFATYNNLNVNVPYRYTYTLNKCITSIADKSILGRMYIRFIKWWRGVLGK